MAANLLDEEQRLKLIEWLAAGHPLALIEQLFAVRRWPMPSRQGIEYHRRTHREEIDRQRAVREARAYDAGLAQREARVKALVEHAETLAGIMWQADEKGKLHNEKAWRETLDDIAKEMGHRRTGIDLHQAFGRMSDEELDAYIAGAEQALVETGESASVGPAPGDEGQSLVRTDELSE